MKLTWAVLKDLPWCLHFGLGFQWTQSGSDRLGFLLGFSTGVRRDGIFRALTGGIFVLILHFFFHYIIFIPECARIRGKFSEMGEQNSAFVRLISKRTQCTSVTERWFNILLTNWCIFTLDNFRDCGIMSVYNLFAKRNSYGGFPWKNSDVFCPLFWLSSW